MGKKTLLLLGMVSALLVTGCGKDKKDERFNYENKNTLICSSKGMSELNLPAFEVKGENYLKRDILIYDKTGSKLTDYHTETTFTYPDKSEKEVKALIETVKNGLCLSDDVVVKSCTTEIVGKNKIVTRTVYDVEKMIENKVMLEKATRTKDETYELDIDYKRKENSSYSAWTCTK